MVHAREPSCGQGMEDMSGRTQKPLHLDHFLFPEDGFEAAKEERPTPLVRFVDEVDVDAHEVPAFPLDRGATSPSLLGPTNVWSTTGSGMAGSGLAAGRGLSSDAES